MGGYKECLWDEALDLLPLPSCSGGYHVRPDTILHVVLVSEKKNVELKKLKNKTEQAKSLKKGLKWLLRHNPNNCNKTTQHKKFTFLLIFTFFY